VHEKVREREKLNLAIISMVQRYESNYYRPNIKAIVYEVLVSFLPIYSRLEEINIHKIRCTRKQNSIIQTEKRSAPEGTAAELVTTLFAPESSRGEGTVFPGTLVPLAFCACLLF